MSLLRTFNPAKLLRCLHITTASTNLLDDCLTQATGFTLGLKEADDVVLTN
jgi:hypothetical protein